MGKVASNVVSAKPLEVGAKLSCRWRGDEFKSCEVIERQFRTADEIVGGGGSCSNETGEWEYYVHYDGLNRRLDEWVRLERFDLGTVTEDGKLTRTSSKRKMHDHEEHEEEGELDLATLKEHEEATKV